VWSTLKKPISPEMTRIAVDLQQGFAAGAKQYSVDEAFVLQGERCQFARKSEDHVDVAGGQQFVFAGREPALASVALAAWTVPVTTRVVGEGDMSAGGALIAMSTQRGSPAARDG
jgi:hypothetical protein